MNQTAKDDIITWDWDEYLTDLSRVCVNQIQHLWVAKVAIETESYLLKFI